MAGEGRYRVRDAGVGVVLALRELGEAIPADVEHLDALVLYGVVLQRLDHMLEVLGFGDDA